MAIYYMNVQIIGRSAGRTATGAAAYRAGERIADERTGQVFDYTRRRGEIEAEILAPEGAPAWVHDRSRLWNEVERAERRGDAQVAREIVVAFPIELSTEQQRELIREYVREEFVARGMAADMAVHRNPGNPHAHIMLTMREVGPGGLSSKKNREWNKPEMLERWRAEWASRANHALERAGREERIDHRSLAEQGVERLPQLHLGPHASALERQGVVTEKGDHNRLVAEHNAIVIDLEKARADKKALQVEKSVSDRQATRIKAGWQPEDAAAIAKIEEAGGGKTYTWQDLSKMQSDLNSEYRSLIVQIRAIEDEGRRLISAANSLKDHKEALEQLRRHQGPLAAFKRLFSGDARNAFQQVVYRVEWTGDNLLANRVTGEADLRQQQTAWQQDQAQLPTLEAKAGALTDKMNTVTRACCGLEMEEARRRAREERAKELELQRRLDQLERQRRPQGRSMDRGR